MRDLLDRAATWLDLHFGYKPEPTRLDCGCDRDRIIVGCLRCDYAVCEQRRSDPHECAPEGARP